VWKGIRKGRCPDVSLPVPICFLYMQVVVEASVGNVGMSDIAVDDVTFVQGPCPGMLIAKYINS
jgi:hypothetical protein